MCPKQRQQQQYKFPLESSPFCCVTFCEISCGRPILHTPRMPPGGAESGRAYLRYEWMTVAMALAEATHHTAPRGQRTASARKEEREVHYTAAFRMTVPPPEPELFDLFEEPGGVRPNLLLEPQGPQLGVQRHTPLHIVDILPYVQILDVPVPQLGNQVVEFMQTLDTEPLPLPPSRLSKCPSSLITVFHSVLRYVVHRRQNSWWKCRRSLTFRLLIVVVVVREVFKVYAQNRVQQHRFLLQNAFLSGLWSRTLTFPFRGRGLHVLPDPGGSSSSAGEGFFRTFPRVQKKSEVRRQSESEGARLVELMDSGGSCGGSGRGRVRRVLRRVQRRFAEAGLGLLVPVLLLVRSPPF